MHMRRFLIGAIVGAILLAHPFAAGAQEDTEGSTDHPMLSRFPGYYIEDYEAQDFSSYDFQLAGDKEQKVEGG